MDETEYIGEDLATIQLYKSSFWAIIFLTLEITILLFLTLTNSYSRIRKVIARTRGVSRPRGCGSNGPRPSELGPVEWRGHGLPTLFRHSLNAIARRLDLQAAWLSVEDGDVKTERLVSLTVT